MKKYANSVAAAAFVLGSWGFHSYAERLREGAAGGVPEQVLVVTREFGVGQVVTEEALARVEIPRDYLDDRRVRAADLQKVVGVTLTNPLATGDGIMWSDLADGAARRHLASLVEPGKRAYRLGSEANPLGGLLRVGDTVDVLVERGGASETLLERLRVLAVGSDLGDDDSEEEGFSSDGGVTLSVSPSQAEKLQAAEARGDLRLVIRNPSDRRVNDEPRPISPSAQAHPARAVRTNREIEHVR